MTRAEFIARWGCSGMDHVNQDLERDLDALLAEERIWCAVQMIEGVSGIFTKDQIMELRKTLGDKAKAIRSGGKAG